MNFSDKVLLSLLTNKEKKRLQKRLEILTLLKNGLGVRKIAKEKKSSTATIVELKKRFLPHLFQKAKAVRGKKQGIRKEIPWRLG